MRAQKEGGDAAGVDTDRARKGGIAPLTDKVLHLLGSNLVKRVGEAKLIVQLHGFAAVWVTRRRGSTIAYCVCVCVRERERARYSPRCPSGVFFYFIKSVS